MPGAKRLPIKERSGLTINSYKLIPPLRRGHYYVHKRFVGGDAPKNFISVYDYGANCRKRNISTWPSYIAKIGHKSYPNESITEQLITRIGQVSGFGMADSRLMRVDEQIRFLSRYFLKPDEVLTHGAEIFAAYLDDPNLELVNEVEQKRLAPEWFTYEFICNAVSAVFPEQQEEILKGFVKMLAFDAIIGNNDRHHYNWGVIVDIRGSKPPRFSPIYDSARGLFWNATDSRLKQKVLHPRSKVLHPPLVRDYIGAYTERSKPQTGWEASGKLGHFELLSRILEKDPHHQASLLEHCSDETLEEIQGMVNNEFRGMMTPLRLTLIAECLSLRFERYTSLVKGVHLDSLVQET